RVTFARLDELQVHRADAVEILLDHRVHRSPALGNVALKPPDETDVRIGVYEYSYVKQPPKFRFGENQYPFDQDDWLRLDDPHLGRAAKGGEVVDGHGDRLPVFEPVQVLDQQRRFQGVGMVKVDSLTGRAGNIVQVFVVRVVFQISDVLGPHAIQDGIRDGRLTGTGAASHTDRDGCGALRLVGHKAVPRKAARQANYIRNAHSGHAPGHL